jgi:hypothetical protein
LGCSGILNNVKIGDDVAFGIPNKSGTDPLRYLLKIQRKQMPSNSDSGDVDHRGKLV